KEIKQLSEARYNAISEIIDLTESDFKDDKDHAPERKSAPVQSVTSAGQKRKRGAAELGDVQNDRGGQLNSEFSAKRRCRPRHKQESSQRTRRSRTLILNPETITVTQGDRQPAYRVDKDANAWKGTSGTLVYRGMSSDDMDSVVLVGVRPKGDKAPVFLYQEKGEDGDIVFEGYDVNGDLVVANKGEVRDMLCDPNGHYVGFVFQSEYSLYSN
ncbi:hypothetical protein QBC46DRAFT_414728, partial [Diplogelasinospora grovesii]